MNIKPNDSATGYAPDGYFNKGLTVRAQIAAMCLQGLLASPKGTKFSIKVIAEAAIVAADELIKQLNETS